MLKKKPKKKNPNDRPIAVVVICVSVLRLDHLSVPSSRSVERPGDPIVRTFCFPTWNLPISVITSVLVLHLDHLNVPSSRSAGRLGDLMGRTFFFFFFPTWNLISVSVLHLDHLCVPCSQCGASLWDLID